LKFSDRVKRVKPSFTLEMTSRAAELRAKGVDVINFSVGEPDFNTPDHIIRAGKEAMDNGFTKYTAGSGMIELREAICEKLERDNELYYDPNQVLVSNGEKQSLFTACQVLFQQGDEVIIFSPYWVSFPEFVRLADAEPIIVKTDPNNQFEPDFDDLQLKITNKTKGVIINSPSNPTGGVWSEEAIIKILEGPIGIMDCSIDTNCVQLDICNIRKPISRVNDAIISMFDNLTLSEITGI